MQSKIFPGVVAVIIMSSVADDIGVMVNVEHPYHGPLPDDEDRRTNWWIVLPRAPLGISRVAEESEGSDVLDADDINVEGRYLVNGDCLLPLIAGAKPGAALSLGCPLSLRVSGH